MKPRRLALLLLAALAGCGLAEKHIVVDIGEGGSVTIPKLGSIVGPARYESWPARSSGGEERPPTIEQERRSSAGAPDTG